MTENTAFCYIFFRQYIIAREKSGLTVDLVPANRALLRCLRRHLASSKRLECRQETLRPGLKSGCF